MTLKTREKRAVLIWVVAMVLGGLYFLLSSSGGNGGVPKVVGAIDSAPQSERRLAQLREKAAMVPAKDNILKQVSVELKQREKGMLEADTAPQAQAQLLQVLRRVGKTQTPPIDMRGVELGQVRSLSADYGEALVSVTFDCHIEQLVNYLSALSAQPEIVAPSEIRVSTQNQEQKMISVRLTASGVVPHRLVPKDRGTSTF